MTAPKDPEKRKLWIERMSGKNNPMYGKKNPDLAERNRQRTGKKAPMFGKKGKDHPRFGKKNPALAEYNRQRTGEKRSKETIEKMSGKNNHNFGKRGAETSNWKNGISVLYDIIRKCFLYRQWHSDIFTRDKFTCQHCNKRGGDLHAHHKESFALILKRNNIETLKQAELCSELWNINNGITLCKKCHKVEHKKIRLRKKRDKI